MDKDFCFSVMLLNEIAADSLSKKLDPCLCIFLTNSISCRQLICWHSGMQCQSLPAFNIDQICGWEKKKIGIGGVVAAAEGQLCLKVPTWFCC